MASSPRPQRLLQTDIAAKLRNVGGTPRALQGRLIARRGFGPVAIERGLRQALSSTPCSKSRARRVHFDRREPHLRPAKVGFLGTFWPRHESKSQTSILFALGPANGKNARLCDLSRNCWLRRLDPHRRPKLERARLMGLRGSAPHRDWTPERFRRLLGTSRRPTDGSLSRSHPPAG